MISNIKLPKDYKPFPKIIVCGNTLIGVQIIFELFGEIPLLIGYDNSPKIWLKAVISKQHRQFLEIVRSNKSLHKSVKVIGGGTYNISVTISNKTIISLHKNNEGIPEVTKLDLHPIGFNIEGDSQKLMIGSNRLEENTFSNVHTMIGIGVNSP